MPTEDEFLDIFVAILIIGYLGSEKFYCTTGVYEIGIETYRF